MKAHSSTHAVLAPGHYVPPTQPSSGPAHKVLYSLASQSKYLQDRSSYIHQEKTVTPNTTLYRWQGDTVVDGRPLPGPPFNLHSHLHRTRQTRCTNCARPTSSTVSTHRQGLHAGSGNETWLYQASIRSALTYTAPVWCSTSTTNYQILQTVQNKCLRVISNSPRDTPILLLHTNLGVDLIQTYIRHLAARFYAQCQHHPNPLIGNTGNYTIPELAALYRRYKHKRPKHILL